MILLESQERIYEPIDNPDFMILNRRVKESIKTALAMTITLGIALSMDWDRPYWAGFAVAVISLSTIGQSLTKGVRRLLGTLLALVVSLFIIGQFVQDRWLFMATLSVWVGFCTYRMGVSRHSYFWFLAGFASTVIAFDGGTNPANAFDTAILRAQETFLGVLVYTLVTTLLWPNSSRAGFESATQALVKAQHQLFLNYRETTGRLRNQDESKQDMQAISALQVQSLTQFEAMLEAALADCNDVWERRYQWHRFQEQSIVLYNTLERLYETRKELNDLDLNVLIPNFEAVVVEIDGRFAEIERLLAGEVRQHQPQMFDLSPDQDHLHELSNFHKAAFALFRKNLLRLDELTREQFDTVLDINGLGVSTSLPVGVLKQLEQQGSGLLPDTDSMIAAIRVMAGLWMAYLLWIYVRIPDGNSIVSISVPYGMLLATNPRLPALNVLKFALSIIALTGILYVFVMPQLSSFVGLGTMVFLCVFAITYLLSAPDQGVIRSIFLAMFLITMGVSNSSQQYNILSVIDLAVMITILIGVLILASHIPFSPQPDKVFLRLLRRFFHSSGYLMTTMHWDLTISSTRLDYWRRVFYARELAALPQKLSAWGKVVNTGVLSETTSEQLQMLIFSLQILAHRMRELVDAHANLHENSQMHELLTDASDWRLKIQEVLSGFSRGKAIVPVNKLREQLTVILEHLDVRVEEMLNKEGRDKFSAQDEENFYRLLGAYHELSEAVIDYAEIAEGIGWKQWRESRF